MTQGDLEKAVADSLGVGKDRIQVVGIPPGQKISGEAQTVSQRFRSRDATRSAPSRPHEHARCVREVRLAYLGVHTQVTIAILEKFPATAVYQLKDPIRDDLAEELVKSCGIIAAGPGEPAYVPPNIEAIMKWQGVEAGYWHAEARQDVGEMSARSSRGQLMRAGDARRVTAAILARDRADSGRRNLGSIARHDLTQVNVNCPASEAQACVDRLSDPDAVNILFEELDVFGVEPLVFAATVNPSVEVTLKCCHHTVISSTRPVITKHRRSGARAASPPSCAGTDGAARRQSECVRPRREHDRH